MAAKLGDMDEAEAQLMETRAKHDARGRRLESWDERERITLAAYDRSGLTQRASAQREGFRYNTFIWLLKQRRDRAYGEAASQAGAVCGVSLAGARCADDAVGSLFAR